MEIGVPENVKGLNKFANIKKAKAKPKAGAQKADVNKGKILNELAGASGLKNNIYVDAKEHNKMGKDEFMKLLGHQLRNQDPFKPMDQNKMAAELAQFAQLEQLTNMNSSMRSMNKNAPMESKFFAASFIGKEVVTSGASISLKGGGASSRVSFNLLNDAKKVIVRVMDQRNQTVQQFDFEDLAKGSQTVSWNGKALDGGLAAPGNYRIQVNAWDKNLTPVKAETHGTGLVTAVNFKDGEAVLKLNNGRRVFLRDVTSFHQAGSKLTNKNAMPAKQVKESFNNSVLKNYNQEKQ